MKRSITLLAIAAIAGLSACGQSNESEAVENAYENKAEDIENQADALDEQAANATGAAEDALENQADATHERAENVAAEGEDKAAAVNDNSN